MNDRTPPLAQHIKHLTALDMSLNKSQPESGSYANTNKTTKASATNMDSKIDSASGIVGMAQDDGLTCYNCGRVGYIYCNFPNHDLTWCCSNMLRSAIMLDQWRLFTHARAWNWEVPQPVEKWVDGLPLSTGSSGDEQWGVEQVEESFRLRLGGGKRQKRSVAAAVPLIPAPLCTVLAKKVVKWMPGSQFKFFTHCHHLKVSKLQDSVVNLLRFKGNIWYQTQGGWWTHTMTKVVKEWWCVRELCGSEDPWWSKTPQGCPECKGIEIDDCGDG